MVLAGRGLPSLGFAHATSPPASKPLGYSPKGEAARADEPLG